MSCGGLSILTLLNFVPSPTHLYASLVWDIKEILNRSWIVAFHHTLREGNAFAEFLVKHGAHQDGALVVTKHSSEGMRLLLLANDIGITSMRH